MSYYYRRGSKYDIYITLGVFFGLAVYKFWSLHPKLSMFIILVGIPMCYLAGNCLIDLDYKKSIKRVRLTFVKSKNTIGNAHCTVKYVPDDKIIVMENIATRNKKRMITLTKKGRFKINKLWSEACRVFDDYSTFQTMMLLLDAPEDLVVYLDSKPKTVEAPKEPQQRQINIDNSKIGPKFVELGAVVPDKFGLTDGVQAQGTEFVDMNGISKQKPTVERPQEAVEFVNMNSVMDSSGNKIDVNNVQAPELAVLPGINIVLAKKIIEHRNINGNFKSVEEFLEIANVKPHFVSKIKSMIVVGDNSVQYDNDDNNYEGRIVDF